MEKREVKKLRKYVEEDNELDIQVRQMQKTIAKQGKYIEEWFVFAKSHRKNKLFRSCFLQHTMFFRNLVKRHPKYV